MRISLAASLIAVLFLSACSTVKLSYDYNEEYDFSQVERFATAPRSYTGRATAIVSDMTHEFIDDSIVDTLKENGFKHVGTVGNPDVIVSYHVVTSNKEDLDYYNSKRNYACWNCESDAATTAPVDDHTEGTLIVDMIDTKSNKPVWRGVASKHLEPKNTPAKRSAMVKKVIVSLFEGFPPERSASSAVMTEADTEIEKGTKVETAPETEVQDTIE